MRYLEEKRSSVSLLIENQFPSFLKDSNSKFLKFLESYYESLENSYQPLDIVSNLIQYYNIGYYRSNQLVEKTTITSNLLKTDTTITVSSTLGFPLTNGYIKIDDEIIFYKEKTETQFLDCVRGTSALVLENIPQSQVILVNSTTEEHASGTDVINVAYTYSSEFFRRIKSEIANLIPEKLISELDISAFIKNIKTFYSAKGSLNSHRILFKILFNDRKYRLILTPRGSGAQIKINNYLQSIPKTPPPTIISGGSGYDGRKDSNNIFVNSPVIDIIGSGTGEVNDKGLSPNKTAIVKVTGIDQTGAITSLEVVDGGTNYVGPITAKVRPRSFFQDQLVYNNTGTGRGRVEYWDPFTNELILTDVIGYFKADDEIISVGREEARGFVSRIFVGTTSIKDGSEIVPEVQNIEFPRDYTFKTSDSKYTKRVNIKLRLLSGNVSSSLRDTLTVFSLVQDSDEKFGVPGCKIKVDNFVSLNGNISEYEVSADSDIDKIYLPPATVAVLGTAGISNEYLDENNFDNLTITVDDASGFPLTNGFIFVNGRVIEYQTRSSNQFFNCSYLGDDEFDISIGDKVLSWGRKKYNVEWKVEEKINAGDFRFFGENLYRSVNSGTTSKLSTNAPTHLSGIQKDGSYADGDSNPVEWEYVGSNVFNYYFYIESSAESSDAKFELIALPGEVVIEDGGSLHSRQQFEFAELDDPNTQTYDFTTNELSNRLSILLSSNINRTHETVTGYYQYLNDGVLTTSPLPSYNSVCGFTTQYDYLDYIYVPSSGIPFWWNEIVDLSTTLPEEDQKKISFVNQKLLTRWKKSGLVYETQAIGVQDPTQKAVALNVDAININSYKGNVIRYGEIDNIIISNGGEYQVPIKSSGYGVDKTKMPPVYVNGDKEVSTSDHLYISASIKKIDVTKLYETEYSENLTGFASRPSIQIINNNPRKILNAAKSNISTTPGVNTITVVYNESSADQIISTAQRVKYVGSYITSTGKYVTNLLPNLKEGSYYFVRNQTPASDTSVTYSLHETETDCLLNDNKISLTYLTSSTFNVLFETDPVNPVDYQEADIQLSFNENTGSIDNFVILNPGSGYVECPQIRLSGGGKFVDTYFDLPYEVDGERIINFSGKLISKNNYYNNNYYIVPNNDFIDGSFEDSPSIIVDSGSGATASVYTSNGKIASIILISAGKNYFIKPTVKITGNGKNAVVEAIINDKGNVIGYDIINPGEGYTLPAKITILPSGDGASVSSTLKEWTFNMVQRLKSLDRIDAYGGYVYHESDSIADSDVNPKGFVQINPKQNLSPSINDRQYLLLQSSDKLLAEYTRRQRDGFLKYLYPDRNLQTNPLTDSEALSSQVHSPAIAISYDGIPIYGKRGYSVKNNPLSTVTEMRSRWRLKYSTTEIDNSIEVTVGSTTYYVGRPGGPSIEDYPIGTFVEDYEYVSTTNVNALDEHNGRFCVTPEFPGGRYCYFATTRSYDSVTNSIISQSGVAFNGYPYFIGPYYASSVDPYPNNGCRTNDKIPKDFNRITERSIPPVEIAGYFSFPGLPKNVNYPQENTKLGKTIARTSSVSPGTIDSVIIESGGTNYAVGDKLSVDNTLTSGVGFSAVVSKVSGSNISKVGYIEKSTKVEISTSENHNLSVGDYVYFDYDVPEQPIQINLHGLDSLIYPLSAKIKESIDLSVTSNINTADTFKNKKFYTITLNRKFKYNFILPSSTYTLSYDIEKVNEYFISGTELSSTVLTLDVSSLPSTLYLHVGNYIYEISKSVEYIGEYRVTDIDSVNNTFIFDAGTNTSYYETSGIKYSTKSRNVLGTISEVSISSPGFNYRKLPDITGVISEKGTGAILQSNSNTIGEIKKVSYLTSGTGFTSNKNVKYSLNIPSTAKFVNNFEIYDVEIIDGGLEYGDVLSVKVNGKFNLANIKVTTQIGTITSVEVLDGGSFFSEIPTLEVVSSTGAGCKLKALIRRKQLLSGNKLIVKQDVTSLFPVENVSTVVNFDSKNSTLEFNEDIGQFSDGQVVYTEDGRPYGRIVSIKRSKAHAKVSPFVRLPNVRNDITGNTSETLQKITDSNIYQNWSYIISSSRDTVEWREQVLVNTHPSGHRLFGKKIIERRKFFFDNPEQIFKSSVIFTTALKNEILLKVKLSPCQERTLSFTDVSLFSVGDFIIGTISGAIGEVIDITDMSIKVKLRNKLEFKHGEVVLKISPEFAFGLVSSTDKFITFWEGILQEPEYSYEVSPFDQIGLQSDVFIPKFTVSNNDRIILHKLTTDFNYLDTKVLKSSDQSFDLTYDGITYDINESIKEQFIFSIGGAVQNPSKYTVSNNSVLLSETVKYDNTRLFSLRHDKLKVLSFTGSDTGTTFTIDQTPSDECKLLIFSESVGQSNLLNNWQLSGSTIIFDETVEKDKIFGWYIDEDVECYQVDPVDLNKFRITAIRSCSTKNFTQFINSSSVKHPLSIYEIRKDILDGTVVGDSDGVTVYGFDTKFTYTSPSHSSSYVEVLDPIPFNGTTKKFKLTRFGLDYTPKNVERSTVVCVDNQVLDHDSYIISGTFITFSTAYAAGTECTILDFSTGFKSNYSNKNCEILDRLNVKQDGIRKTFNLSDRGVPHYARNPGDIFVLENNILKRPELRSYKNNQDSITQSITNNKITFTEAPESSDKIDLVYFNRQLLPEPTKNVVLDDFRCFNGIKTDFPLTVNGILFEPQYENNLFVWRNGVYQKPFTDYFIVGNQISFTTVPEKGEILFIYYSFDGLNQNLKLDTFKKFDGIQSDFALTENYVSTYLDNNYDVMVYRNGVYQHPEFDYTVLNKTTGPYIRFFTAPVPEDDIYIINFNSTNNDDLVEVTSRFTQVDQNTVLYADTSPSIDTAVFLIYLNGILQVNTSWEYDTGTNELTFDEPVDLSSGKISIFAFVNKKRILKPIPILSLDSFKKFDGTQTKFALTKNYIGAEILSEINILVYKNGVYQYPGSDYTVSDYDNSEFLVGQNSEKVIEFTTAPLDTDNIFITRLGETDIVDVTSRFSQLTTDSIQYTEDPLNPVDTSVFLIYVDGELLSTTFWSFSSGVITFGGDLSLSTDNVVIYAFKTQKRAFDNIEVVKLDDFRYFDSVNTDFALTYNYKNSTIISQENIHVFRNGVYQYPDSDYTVLGSSDAKYIRFTTAPDPSDDIFIINHNNSDITDVTSSFSGVGSTSTLTYTPVSGVYTDVFLIYVNGIPQVNWSFDSGTNTLTLGDAIDLSIDKVKIFAFKSQKYILDTFTITSSSTYELEFGTGPSIVDFATDLAVIIDGVYQEPNVAYTVVEGSSSITLLDQTHNIGSTVHIYRLGLGYESNVLDDIDDNYNKKTFKLQNNFKWHDVFGTNSLKVVKNGTTLSYTTHYTSGDGYITFKNSVSVTESDTIEIYVKQYRLSQSGVAITSNYPSSTDIVVSDAGIVQQPQVVYTMSTNILTLVDPVPFAGHVLDVYQISSNTSDLLDYIDDNYTKNTFKLSSNYVYYDVSDSGDIFVYKNGELLSQGTQYTFGDGYITFTSPLLESDLLLISPYKYNLIDSADNSIITTDLPNTEEDLLVNIHGVCQNPTNSYTVNGSVITLQNAPSMINPFDYSSEFVYIYQVGSSINDVVVIDYIDDNYTKSTYKLALNYKSFNPPNIGDVLVTRNSVVQNPVDDFIIGNGFITFTTNITEDDDIFILYTHGAEEIGISNITNSSFTLSETIDPSDYKNLILYLNGAPKFYTFDFTISDNIITLNEVLPVDPGTTPFVLKYPNITFVDNINDCPDGSKTRFKLLYTFPEGLLTNLVAEDIVSDADILVSVNGIVKYPGVQYTISENRAFIDFVTPPLESDEIFFVRMSGNEVIHLNKTSTDLTYNLSQSIEFNQDSLVIFKDNLWTFNGNTSEVFVYEMTTRDNGVVEAEASVSSGLFRLRETGTSVSVGVKSPSANDEAGYTYVDNDTIKLKTDALQISSFETKLRNGTVIVPEADPTLMRGGSPLVSIVDGIVSLRSGSTISINGDSVAQSYLFGIKFTGLSLLDQINTPYNSFNKKFNLFISQQNFVPYGTIENDTAADETSLFVMKNGKILDPKVDYTLTGDIKSQIVFNTPPAETDVISVRTFGSFRKLQSITSGLSGKKVFDLKLNSTTAYYPDADISRPRELENQILVLLNGNIQSPVYDYYIDNNKIKFHSNVPTGTTKMVILDFRGTVDDVKVDNRFYQTNVGDEITIGGENTPRKVTEILSPTVLKTEEFTETSPAGFVGTVSYSGGKVTDIVVTNGGLHYEHPVVFRTKGSGTGAKAVADVNYFEGGVIKDNTVQLQYPGYNIYTPQEVVATAYSFTYNEQPLSKSQIRKATKLTSTISSTTEVLSLKNTENMLSNPPSISATAETGGGATFRAYVSDGKIRKVDVLTQGIGYDDRTIELNVTGGGGDGCVLEPVLDALGRFSSVIVRNGGSGYDTFRVIVYDPSDTTVDAEFIEYTYVTETQILGCTRGTGKESYPADTMVYFDYYL